MTQAESAFTIKIDMALRQFYRSLRLTEHHWLFGFFALLYYSTHFPIAGSNEGCHYALLLSFFEPIPLILDRVSHFTAGVDFAFKDGHFIPDRPPGVALASLPFYLAGRALVGTGLIEQPLDDFLRHVVLIGTALAGSASVCLVSLILTQLQVSRGARLLTVFFFGICSLQWKFSSHLFSHVYLEFLVLLLFFLQLSFLSKKPKSLIWFGM